MKFKELINHLTGFSTPIFGVSWNPLQLEVTVAHKTITFLEDRRVLYAPFEMELPAYCVRSVLEIREFLTDQIGALASDSQLASNLSAMRGACRKFLNEVGDESSDIIQFGSRQNHWASWVFNSAIGVAGCF